MNKLTKVVLDCAEDNGQDLSLSFAKNIAKAIYAAIEKKVQKSGFFEIPNFGKLV